MLIISKIDKKKWLWVNVPKTASTAVMRTFFPSMGINEQQHNSYEELINQYGVLDAFTTVRNPIQRFKSALNHTFNVCACGNCEFSNSLVDTIDVIYFLRDMLMLKNQRKDFFKAVYKNGESNYHINVSDSMVNRFSKYINCKNTNCLRVPAYVSQTFMLEGPQKNLRIFKYEKLEELSRFIDEELGYKLNNTIYRKYPNKLGVDFSDTTLLDLLHELYREDFENFNY